MMIHSKIYKQGFTLIELLLYVSVAGLLIFGVAIAVHLLFVGRVKSQVINEVESQGASVMAYVTQLARNADIVTGPIRGTTSSTLTLDVFLPANDPTIINLGSSTIRVKEGASSTIDLTNQKVVASGLLFSNLSRASTTPGIVRIQFTLAYASSSMRSEYSYQKTFIGSASLR